MRSMVEGALPSAVRGLAPCTAFGGPPPPSLRAEEEFGLRALRLACGERLGMSVVG
jgi:hypothetical protein